MSTSLKKIHPPYHYIQTHTHTYESNHSDTQYITFLRFLLLSSFFHGNFILLLGKNEWMNEGLKKRHRLTAQCNNEKVFLCQLDECEIVSCVFSFISGCLVPWHWHTNPNSERRDYFSSAARMASSYNNKKRELRRYAEKSGGWTTKPTDKKGPTRHGVCRHSSVAHQHQCGTPCNEII